MAINFQPAKITVDDKGVAVDVGFGTDNAMTHLTKGFVSANTKRQKDAFTITGDVDVIVDQPAEANALINGPWKFGFIQVARVKSISFTWSGRRGSEGEVELVLPIPPAWPPDKLVSIDADPLNPPFMSPGHHLGFRNQQGAQILVQISNSMGDHPAQGCSSTAPNSSTKSTNYLSSMERELEAFSVFFARDDKGKFHHLAHVRWVLSTGASFQWRANKPVKRRVSGSLRFDQPVQGAPADPAILAVLNNPGPPFTNDITDDAVPIALANRLNKRDAEKRGLFITKDFYL